MRRPLRKRLLWAGAALVALLPAAARDAQTDPPPAKAAATAPQVLLKGGTTLAGRVVREVAVAGVPHVVVGTDFGEVLVAKAQVLRRDEPQAPSDTFTAHEVRIVRIEGPVRKRRAGATDWVAISEGVDYDGPPLAPATLAVGDSMRTGPGARVDLLLHMAVWVRVQPESEVEISPSGAGGSLSLLRGTTLQQVDGLPRGATFRVKTASGVLGVKGTRFSATAHAAGVSAAVVEGEVELDQRGTIAAGQEAAWEREGPLRLAAITPSARDILSQARPAWRPADDMVYVPAGTYRLGARSAGGDTGSPEHGSRLVVGYEREGPVEVRAFLIDRREVTLADFAAYLASEELASASPPVRSPLDRQPMFDRDYPRAEAYARWLGKRLPTSTQWEVAARGADARPFPWGGEALREALPAGTWAGDPRADPDRVTWVPPVALPSVDDATPDVSVFGVEALVSGAPEFVRPGLRGDATFGLLSADWQRRVTSSTVCVRGAFGSLLTVLPLTYSPIWVGWRCVIELDRP